MFKKVIIGLGVIGAGVAGYKNKEKLKAAGTKALAKVKEVKTLKKLLPKRG